ncbi:glycosyl hydrolase [uncultured Allomuricauda sp.]|uniref:glycoside hydrolase family 26 protein n=1 Tax=Flagellimonas sp. W118 TaxID=3410791 RepID=UPI0026178B95|nr:glycosyl hydrolase [uncultured Allomuricauda sp.]
MYYLLFMIFFLISTSIELSGQTVTKKTTDQIAQEMVSKIQTDIDSNFVYDYEHSKFVPPDGKTLLIMGQTVERITEYMEHFQDQPIPGGWSAYWGIPEFKGVTSIHKNESGDSQNHQMLIDNFPNTVVHSAMWMVGKGNVAKYAGNGEYDRVIKKYSAWAKSVNRPIYLRIGYEFDGPHNELEPEEFVKAYRHIVDLIRKKGVNNIAFVWHSYASKPFKDYPLSAWYPGDDYVDWVAISVFGHAYNGTDFGPYSDDVLKFAKQHKKPVMIAESNPINGIDNKSVEVWGQWFVNFFTFIYQKNIKAISFINEDWPRTRIPGISAWKDSRLYNNEQVSRAWFEETNKNRYLKQSTELFKQLGYISLDK